MTKRYLNFGAAMIEVRMLTRANKTATIRRFSGVWYVGEQMTNEKIKELYLDYYNNFLTVGKFALWYSLPKHEADYIISKGRRILNEQV